MAGGDVGLEDRELEVEVRRERGEGGVVGGDGFAVAGAVEEGICFGLPGVGRGD